jgi:hypothetical protein
MILPVDFEERVKRPKSNNGGDYPYAIKARDLMQNFVYAAIDVDETLIEDTTGQGGHRQRRLKIPAVPSTGTHVLGAVDGTIQWIATEEC